MKHVKSLVHLQFPPSRIYIGLFFHRFQHFFERNSGTIEIHVIRFETILESSTPNEEETKKESKKKGQHFSLSPFRVNV